MKKSILISSFLFFLSFLLSAQSYISLTLSGFNADVIVDDGETESQSDALDGAGWAYYSQAKKSDGGLPQSFTSRSKILYQLAPFQSQNALHFRNGATRNGTLTFSENIQTSELWFLGIGTDGTGQVSVTINYSDGSNSNARTVSFGDWYKDSPAGTALPGLGRILVRGNNAGQFGDSDNFALLEQVVPANKEKTITSISLQAESTNNITIFAVTALDMNAENPDNKTLHFISNSHLDTQWNWTVKTVIEEYLPKTLRQNFDLFDKYPDFQFNFEGAIKYMWAKEYYPTEYARLKQYIADGRWNIAGGSIDANDVMVPSAESLIRNFLYGQKFYESEFGRKGGRDIMLPDCFGFPYSLPTVAKHCDVIGFHTAKLKWGSAYEYNDLPDIAKWQGVDGSEIYAVLKPDAYDTEAPYRKDMSVDGGIYSDIISSEEKYGVPAVFKYVGNTGDIGGSVADITAQWLNTSVNSDGPIHVKMSTPDEAFADFVQGEGKLPVWNDELAMRAHGVGCYTSQAIIKYWNRKNELLADATEKTSVVSHWLGSLKYQSEPITNAWIRTLWHQFHDDLPGTSIPEAYYYTYNDHILSQLDLSKTLVNSVGGVARSLSTNNMQGIPVVVYNPLSIEREDIAEISIESAGNPTAVTVLDKDGKAIPAQITGYENGKATLIFLAKVPSLGYAAYDVKLNQSGNPETTKTVTATNNTLENDSYKITLNTQGDVSSILDKKQSNKELLSAPVRMAMLFDSVYVWPAWEILYENITAAPREYVDENVQISIAEQGPLRAALKVTRTKGGSTFTQYIRLTSEATADRIDFVNEIDWQTRERLLKAVFPLTATNPVATYDISIGTIERGNSNADSYEFQGHQWADLTNVDNTYGISILNDCKYGWDKPNDNTLRLSLIHTPKAHNYGHQRYQDLGLNKVTYSMYRHMGTWNEATQWEASKLNQPLMAFQTAKHEGELGSTFEFAKVNSDKVAVKALKKAETSDDIIIRVYELTGNPQNNVEITFPANIESASEVNGLEEVTGTVQHSGNKITFDISKYQPKTFAVKLATPAVTEAEPSSVPVTLTYNIDVMSGDTKMDDGEFGESGYAYPAELIPDEIVADGITFTMGSTTDGQLNAIRCMGQTIDLPQSNNATKLYLLAASQHQGGSVADFVIDGKTTTLNIEYFADYIGQWGTYYAPGFYRNENAALTLTHKHDVKENKNIAYQFLYMFKYMIKIEAGAQSITLPQSSDVMVFAISLSDNENDDIIPVSEITSLPGEDYNEQYCGTELAPVAVMASSFINAGEAPAMAADNDPFSKWCTNTSGTQWIEYDFGREISICQWTVTHAGRESEGMITADFRLQYANANGDFVNADVVTGNKANITSRSINTIRTNKVRLAIDKAEQNGTTVRIFSFKVYGDDSKTSGLNETGQNTLPVRTYNYPNPFSDKTVINCTVSDQTTEITLNVYNITGYLVDTVKYPLISGGKQELDWVNKSCASGIYFYSLLANDSNGTQQSNGKMIIMK